ncbi:MAG TPA: acylneuraminate cytidylyltransferase, partial [Promineifilum sp.]|nr:acylneuraminate cytidylyltransferase [Promineifilum sp.]
WTIDYEADYQFIAAVYDALYSSERHFTLEEILAFLSTHPEIGAINQRYAGVNWYRHHLDDLKTVSAEQTRQES